MVEDTVQPLFGGDCLDQRAAALFTYIGYLDNGPRKHASFFCFSRKLIPFFLITIIIMMFSRA